MITKYATTDTPLGKAEYLQLMYEINDSNINDICEKLNINAAMDRDGVILVIADLGFWDGRQLGYKVIDSGNIADCFRSMHGCDYGRWYIDKCGDLRFAGSHHDGTHYCIFRACKREHVQEDKLKALLGIDNPYNEKDLVDYILNYTCRLGDHICKFYGGSLLKYRTHR